jgi:hypothetical protein
MLVVARGFIVARVFAVARMLMRCGMRGITDPRIASALLGRRMHVRMARMVVDAPVPGIRI